MMRLFALFLLKGSSEAYHTAETVCKNCESLMVPSAMVMSFFFRRKAFFAEDLQNTKNSLRSCFSEHFEEMRGAATVLKKL